MKKILFALGILVLMVGCKSHEKIAYVTGAGTALEYPDSLVAPVPDPTLKVGDLLTITVNTTTAEAAAPFNLPIIPSGEAMKKYSIGPNVSMGGGGLQN